MAISLIVFGAAVLIAGYLIAESFISLLGVTNEWIQLVIYFASYWFAYKGILRILIGIDESSRKRR